MSKESLEKRLLEITRDWRLSANTAQDPMERVVLNICADTIEEAIRETRKNG